MEANIPVGKSETMTIANNEDRPPAYFGWRLISIVTLYNIEISLITNFVSPYHRRTDTLSEIIWHPWAVKMDLENFVSSNIKHPFE